MKRNRPPLEFLDATHVNVDGRKLLYFGGTGYLGLSFHSKVRRAMAAAVRKGFLQTGASRATTGEHEVYRETEHQLARFFGVEAAVLVGAGYLAPWTAVQGLQDSVSHLLVETEAHSCGQNAAVLSGKPILRFAQGDPGGLEQAVRSLSKSSRPMVVADGVWARRGGICPVGAYLKSLPRESTLMIDDAHGAGVVGPGGKGVVSGSGIRDSRILQTVSLAKAFGVAGGAVLGSGKNIQRIRQRAASFVGASAPLLPTMAAIQAALQLVAEGSRVLRLQENAQTLFNGLPRQAEVASHPQVPVASIFPSRPGQARRLRQELIAAAIYPSFIHYLQGPPGGFLRLAVQAGHRKGEVQLLTAAVSAGLAGGR